MLILHNDQLIHVDSSSDVLEHYGVKGMRWGERRRMKLYNKYVNKGYTTVAAAQKAEKRYRIERNVALAAAGAALAYGAYRYARRGSGKSLAKNVEKISEVVKDPQALTTSKPIKKNRFKNLLKKKPKVESVLSKEPIIKPAKQPGRIKRYLAKRKADKTAKKLAQISKNNALLRKRADKVVDTIDAFNSRMQRMI